MQATIERLKNQPPETDAAPAAGSIIQAVGDGTTRIGRDRGKHARLALVHCSTLGGTFGQRLSETVR